MDLSYGWYIVILVVSFLLGFWILTGNIFIIIGGCNYRPLNRKNYLFISALAVTDLLSGVSFPVIILLGYLAAWHNKGPQLKVPCLIFLYFNLLTIGTSVLHVLLVSLDRWIAIVHPLWYKTDLTKSRCKLMIAIAWIYSIGHGAFIFYKARSFKQNDYYCNSGLVNPVFITVTCSFFWIVFVVMVSLNVHMIVTILKANRSGVLTNVADNIRRTQRKEMRLVKLVLIVVGVFIICWAPLVLALQLYASELAPVTAVFVCLIPASCNSGVNFFIYAARSEKYRQAFKMVVGMNTKSGTRTTESVEMSNS